MAQLVLCLIGARGPGKNGHCDHSRGIYSEIVIARPVLQAEAISIIVFLLLSMLGHVIQCQVRQRSDTEL